VIVAKEAMLQSVVASMPYMDDENRTNVLRSWAEVADEPFVEKEKPLPPNTDRISFEDFKHEIKQRIA